MRNLVVAALVLACFFAFNAVAASPQKVVTVTQTSAGTTPIDDGMPRVAKSQIRHTIRHAKATDDDVFNLDGNIGGGSDLTSYSDCRSDVRCSAGTCKTQTYSNCKEQVWPTVGSCSAC